MMICSDFSCLESLIGDCNYLPVLFTQFLCLTDTFHHGGWVIILRCNFKILSWKTYFWYFERNENLFLFLPFCLGVYINIP